MEDEAIVVASYLLVGLTEEDIHYVRKHLENYGRLFITDDDPLDSFFVRVMNDSVYPCITLQVKSDVWERFSRTHDLVEFSCVMAQDNILGVLH
jgi:hypothetical protein|nr:MAG TPA: hypothetical protein [Caudoviricetes sp.]